MIIPWLQGGTFHNAVVHSDTQSIKWTAEIQKTSLLTCRILSPKCKRHIPDKRINFKPNGCGKWLNITEY